VNRPSSGALWLRLAFLVYVVGILFYRDSIMDDTFIHLQYARHLREQGMLAFNAGEPSLGATSPLWLLLLAGLGATEIAARLLSVACGAFSIWLFALQARRFCGSLAAAATIAWAGNLWLLRHAPNGMESTCAVFLVLLAFELRARAPSRGRDAMLGLVLAAVCLVRPELALLPLLFFTADLVRPGRFTRLRLWLPLCLLPCVAWGLYAWSQVGHVVPDTVSAKSGGPAALAWIAVLRRSLAMVGIAHPVEGVAIVVALFVQLRRLRSRAVLGAFRHPLAPHVLLALLLVLAYAVLDVQVQPRYLLPVLPAVTLLGCIAWRAVWGGGSRAAVSFVALCLVATFTASALRVLPATRAYSQALRPALVSLVQEVEARSPGRASVATPDIGIVGYYGHVHVVDLGGLVDPRAQEIQNRLGYDEMLRSGAFLDLGPVDFVIDRDRERERFAGHVCRDRRWTPLRTTSISNLGLSRPGPFFYTLYALERTNGSSPP